MGAFDKLDFRRRFRRREISSVTKNSTLFVEVFFLMERQGGGGGGAIFELAASTINR